MKELFNQCVAIANDIFTSKGYQLDATVQIQNIFNCASTDLKFNEVINSKDGRVQAEVRSQVKYICELGLDTAKGRKLVYVKTRGLNTGTRQSPNWVTMPDISISYHALIHVLVRSKSLKHVAVLHTYENYEIAYSGDLNEIPIVKSWETKPTDRGEYTGVFVILSLQDGTTETSFYHLSDILKTHKEYSKSANTWAAHQLSMVAKSAIMEAIRYIPIFDDTISSVVENYDNTMDWDKEPELEKLELTPKSDRWDKAIEVYKRDGNFDLIKKHATLSEANEALIIELAA